MRSFAGQLVFSILIAFFNVMQSPRMEIAAGRCRVKQADTYFIICCFFLINLLLIAVFRAACDGNT